MLKHFLVRWIASGLGLWIAARLLDGVDAAGDSLLVIAVAALIFSVVNTAVKPIVVLLTLPAVILSLGLFMLVINGLMLYLVTVIYPSFVVSSFGAAVLTVLIVWLANYAVSVVVDRKVA
ncbi:phage holin family protein [Candidatus Microgenomates bacterium]|nr:phage holin family protein [Candidatus Microgenomates bacterium]